MPAARRKSNLNIVYLNYIFNQVSPYFYSIGNVGPNGLGSGSEYRSPNDIYIVLSCYVI